MNAIEADYNGVIHPGNDLKITFVVQRQISALVWGNMACQWDTLDEAREHMRRLTGVCRLVRVTTEVVMAADAYILESEAA